MTSSSFKDNRLIIHQTPQKRSITVKSGDGNLYAICRRFYGASGQGARVARVMALNKMWSAEVKAGKVLRLPPK